MLLRAGTVGRVGQTRRGTAPPSAGGSSYDADTSAFIARMTVPPSTEQASAYDYFVVQAKALGVWSLLTDCWFECGHDVQSSKLGLKNVSNLAAIGSELTHYAGYGFGGNGTNQALNSGILIPGGNQNNSSIGTYSLSSSQQTTVDAGNANSAIQLRNATNQLSHRINSATAVTTANQTDATGFYILNRIASGSDALWKDGAKISTNSNVSATPDATYTVWFNGRNGGTPSYSARLIAFSYVGQGIPEASIPAFSELVRETCGRLAASHHALAVSPQTATMYTDFIKQGRTSSYWLGAFDNSDWVLGNTPQLYDDIHAITGKYPKLASWEWADPARPGGPTATAAQAARMKAHHARGGVVSLQWHPCNPVTGNITDDPLASGAGSQYDLDGAPVLNCLSGGTRRTQFLDAMDRLSTFLNTLTDAGGNRIPVILRFWHEIDGAWFWWTSTGTPANTIQLFRDYVDRLRTNGVTNAVIDWNLAGQATVATTYYPGDAYVDVLSTDHYQAGTAPTGLGGIKVVFDALSSTVSRRKPKWIAETGYEDAAGTDMTLYGTKLGGYHKANLALSAGFLLWRSPFGPAVGDANNSNLVSMTSDPACITVT